MQTKPSPTQRRFGYILLAACGLLIACILAGARLVQLLSDVLESNLLVMLPIKHPLELRLQYEASTTPAPVEGQAGTHGSLAALPVREINDPPGRRFKRLQPYNGQLLLQALISGLGDEAYILADDPAIALRAPDSAWREPRSHRRPPGLFFYDGGEVFSNLPLANEPSLRVLPHDTFILGAGIGGARYAYLIRRDVHFYLVFNRATDQDTRHPSWLDLSASFSLANPAPVRELVSPDIHFISPPTDKERISQELYGLDWSTNRSSVFALRKSVVIYNWSRDLLLIVDGGDVYTAHPEAQMAGLAQQLGAKPYIPPVCFTADDDAVYFGFSTGEVFERLLLVRIRLHDLGKPLLAETLGYIACSANNPGSTVCLVARHGTLYLLHETNPDHYPQRLQLLEVPLPGAVASAS